MTHQAIDEGNSTFRFVDLFAGLGGFHLALTRCGGTCVWACEIDETLRKTYFDNFGVTPDADIRSVHPRTLPDHDLLCAGFPCQSFSKAGSQRGLACGTNGDLIYRVLDIVREKLPEFIILENVANLQKHARGETWTMIQSSLEGMGYGVKHAILSPHHFGIPQIRERMFIVARRGDLDSFTWPLTSNTKPSIRCVLDKEPSELKVLSPQLTKCLNVWQTFLNAYPADEELPSFPIWSMEFGATYPYESDYPANLSFCKLKEYRGSHGSQLEGSTAEEVSQKLPSHARSVVPFPTWKRTFIRQNRDLYRRNKEWLDLWIPQILEFPSSLQKFEWNCKGENRTLWSHVIQVRASGVRVKRDTTAPSLVAMTTTQVPIIGWEKRYMTPRECASLQSLPPTFKIPSMPSRAYKALGNAVNAELAFRIAASLMSSI